MRTVALSTAEAELMAATEAAKDCAHLDNVLSGFGARADISLAEDNSAALLMATDVNHSVTSRSKHIEARHFYVRQQCCPSEDDDGNELPPALRMYKCDTKMMRADIMTKPTDAVTFARHRDDMVQLVGAADYSQPVNAEFSIDLPVW